MNDLFLNSEAVLKCNARSFFRLSDTSKMLHLLMVKPHNYDKQTEEETLVFNVSENVIDLAIYRDLFQRKFVYGYFVLMMLLVGLCLLSWFRFEKHLDFRAGDENSVARSTLVSFSKKLQIQSINACLSRQGGLTGWRLVVKI